MRIRVERGIEFGAVTKWLVSMVALLSVGCAGTPIRPDTLSTVTTLDGHTAEWGSLLEGPTLLVFATTWCTSCAREWPDVVAWRTAHPEVRLVYVVSGSETAEVRALVERRPGLADAVVIVDDDGRVARHYDVKATPTVFLHDASLRGPFRSVHDLPTAGHFVPVEDRGTAIGTTYAAVVWVDPGRETEARADLARARDVVEALKATFSEWSAVSEISRVNRLAHVKAVTVSAALREVIAGAIHVAETTDGAFDPTWKPLAALWDAAADAKRWPTDEQRASVCHHVGVRHVALDGARIRFDHPDVRLGLEGVAKGYVIDRVFHSLREAGYDRVLVNIGGDVRVAGRSSDGEGHTFDLVDPYNPSRRATTITVADGAMATSGNYLRRRMIAGREVGHVLDPRTGLPPAFDGSVTVLTRDTAMADALATALFVMGPDEGLAFVSRVPGLSAVYVTRSGVRSTGAP